MPPPRRLQSQRPSLVHLLLGLFGMCVALGIPTPYPAWLVRTPQQNWQRLLASR